MKFIDKIDSIEKANFNTISSPSNSNDGSLENDDPLQVPISKVPVIDVLQMPWYAGNTASKSRLDKIPRGYIVERSQKLNSLLSGAMYYLGTVLRDLKQTGRKAKTAVGDAIPTGVALGAGAAVNNFTPNVIKSLLGKITDKIPSNVLGGKLDSAQASLAEALKSDKSLLERNNLNSLLGIYLTEETGFKYTLPYLNGPIQYDSSWQDEGQGAMSGLVNKGMGIIDEVYNVINITQPGVYIQKPKYFNFEQGGKSVSFNFPLLNTVTNDKAFDYKSNYELLWLLTYQNKPYKTTFARTTPGKIYTVEIPGVVSMPYAYISEMSIDFRGTIRQLPVDTPTTYDAPIPEAYVVNITFTSLLNDFANTMVGSGFTSTIQENKVAFKFK
tara:strand:+ start:336 stop:1490 length:1155 start_codon:yes stop_codon:yes gene_type:complete